MSEPYTPQLVTRLLRSMTDAQLAATKPTSFQLWPARRILKAEVLAEMITNERTRRHG